MPHHLIFEGPELSGKSWLIAQVYNFIEKKYNKEKSVLDGCHWFNCDNSIFGTKYGKFCINKYMEIFDELTEKNLILEKFHISDIVYNRIFRNVKIDYSKEEKELQKLNAKIILCVFKENQDLLKKRINERSQSCIHFKRVAKTPEWYINQQQEYLKEIKKTKLPYLIVDMTEIPNNKHLDILNWIGEN